MAKVQVTVFLVLVIVLALVVVVIVNIRQQITRTVATTETTPITTMTQLLLLIHAGNAFVVTHPPITPQRLTDRT